MISGAWPRSAPGFVADPDAQTHRLDATGAGRRARRIDRETALRLLEDLADYAASGYGDVELLTDIEPSELRLRLGDYRIRFYDLGEWIQILRVVHRREAYR
jgi:ParE toxin of type II toxin-antitoxin system, parDE